MIPRHACTNVLDEHYDALRTKVSYGDSKLPLYLLALLLLV